MLLLLGVGWAGGGALAWLGLVGGVGGRGGGACCGGQLWCFCQMACVGLE